MLFDVDGTLADTEEIHRRSFNRCFAEARLDWVWSRDRYAELLAVTGGKERIRYYLERYRPDFEPPTDMAEFVAELHAAKTAIYTRSVAAGEVPLRPGVKRLLEEVRAGSIRLGITTTTTADNVTALLQHSLAPEAQTWFEVIGAGTVVPAKKPAPDIYRYVMEKMNVLPQECLALEDSANGLRAAREAGVTTLVTLSEYTRDERFDGAVLVLDQLGEPDRPFTVVCGDAGEHRYVTLELLQDLLSRGA